MSTEVELNLRLDGDCRTTFDPSSVKSEESSTIAIDYSTKTVLTSLADESKAKTSSSSCETNDEKQGLLDDMLFDCEITDCALLPRTFWMPCTGMEVR